MNDMLQNFTILYVEDDAIVRKNAVEYLKRVAKKVNLISSFLSIVIIMPMKKVSFYIKMK